MTLEQLRSALDKLMANGKLLEALWTADMKSMAPDDVDENTLQLSLHSFMNGVYFTMVLNRQMAREKWPLDDIKIALEIMRQEIKALLDRDVNTAQRIKFEIKHTQH